MPLTAEELKERRNHIGSSDLAAIMGLDPWRTAYDIWLDKCELLPDEGPITDGGDPRVVGTFLERGVLDFAETRLGRLRRQVAEVVVGSQIVVHTDAVTFEECEPVEAKTVGLFRGVRSDEWWGDDGSWDQVPDRVIIQAHAHMLAWNTSRCHVPALIGGRGFAMLGVTRSDSIIERIVSAANEFWNHVKAKTPPENSRPSLEIVRLIRRTPKKVVEIDGVLIDVWLAAKHMAKGAVEDAEQAQAALLAAMGDAEAATTASEGAVTFYEQSRKGYEVKPATYRVLRHRPKGL